MELKKEIGFVVKNQDYLLYLEGLRSAHINDLILGPSGQALVSSLEGDHLQALMLGNGQPKPGETFELSPQGLRLPVANKTLGRTVSPLGIPIDGRGPIPFGEALLDLEAIAPGINSRLALNHQVRTGFTLVDTILPIGRGQRELIFGDARSGKGSFLLDVMANQKNQDLICIYAAVGKSEIEIKRSVSQLRETGAAAYTAVIAATSSEPAPIIAIAPAVALSLAEEFRRQGADILLVIDDLGLHAKYLREISLLSQHVPGRESYPGNIFYEHSRLVERAGRFKKEFGGGGSITLLPVIETDLDNFTALIPTNLMSQTDGHLLFSAVLSAKGQYPSIDIGRSVTRVGRQVQNKIQKLLSTKIRSLLASYQELKTFSKFEAELTAETQKTLKEAEIVSEFLKQEQGENFSIGNQLVLLGLAFTTAFQEHDLDFCKNKKAQILKIINQDDDLKEERINQFEKLEEFLSFLEKKARVIENLCR